MMVYELKEAYLTSSYENQLEPFILQADFDLKGFKDLQKFCGPDKATTDLLSRIQSEQKMKPEEDTQFTRFRHSREGEHNQVRNKS